MTTWFSDQYTDTGADQSKLGLDIPDASRKHGKVYLSRASVTITTATAGDLVYLMTLQSGDRVHWVNTYLDGGWDASTAMQIGLREFGDNHDGDSISGSVYTHTDFSVASAINTWDASENATQYNLGGECRGERLWEQVNTVAPATYAADPLIAMDLVGTFFLTNITTVGIMMVEVAYTPQGA